MANQRAEALHRSVAQSSARPARTPCATPVRFRPSSTDTARPRTYCARRARLRRPDAPRRPQRDHHADRAAATRRNRAGSRHAVSIPFRARVHADLQRVSADETIVAKLAVVTVGVADGVRDSGGSWTSSRTRSRSRARPAAFPRISKSTLRRWACTITLPPPTSLCRAASNSSRRPIRSSSRSRPSRTEREVEEAAGRPKPPSQIIGPNPRSSEQPGDRDLVVGLGNPGTEYVSTRHNVGFMVVDEVARRYGSTRGSGKTARCRRCDVAHDAVFVKPTSYMNLSGAPVRLISSWYRTPPENVLVVSDDMDLRYGKLTDASVRRSRRT